MRGAAEKVTDACKDQTQHNPQRGEFLSTQQTEAFWHVRQCR